MNYNKESLKQLLEQVNTINKAYAIVRQNTGEDFNLFQILGMETAEVKTHSRFLAELLNPKGSHMQGGTFLKLFVESLNNAQLYEESDKIWLNTEKSSVQVEKYIGQKIDDEGGRIDICIKDADSQHIICIENKIYAGEQDKQMERYGNYAKNFKKSHLFFLTLWGDEATTSGNERVYSISYKMHIVEWLELCKKEATDLPILRETIGQYINLIKKLTNQTTNKKMEKDIQHIILRNITEAKLIANNYNSAILQLADSIIKGVRDGIKAQLDSGWEISCENVKSEKERGKIWIRPIASNTPWIIGIEDFNPLFQSPIFNHKIFMGIGSAFQKANYSTHYSEITQQFLDQSPIDFWNTYTFLKNYNDIEVNLSRPELMAEVSTEKKLESFIKYVTNEFINYFNEHKDIFIDFLKKEQEFIAKFPENDIQSLLNKQNVKGVLGTLYDLFKKEEYSKLGKGGIRIWDIRNEECLVFDFINDISVDIHPKEDGVELKLFRRKNSQFIGNEVSELGSLLGLNENNGCFVNKYPKEDMLHAIVSDVKEKLKKIDGNIA